MNRQRFLSRVAITVLVIISVMAGVWYLSLKPSGQINSPPTLQSRTATTTDADACSNIGLPEGFYSVEGVYCKPTEAHQALVERLWRGEYEAGDDHRFAFIKNVYEKAGSIYIKADYFEWLSSSDGSCGSATTPECNPNGFLIVNENPMIRTFELSSDVRVRLMEEFGTIPDLRTLSPNEFMNGRNKSGQRFYVYTYENNAEPYYPPFSLTFKKGGILYLHQVYVP